MDVVAVSFGVAVGGVGISIDTVDSEDVSDIPVWRSSAITF